jgi:hypothetical protein
MKKIVTGAAVLIAGAILFSVIFIAAGSIGTEGGHYLEHGRFYAAILQNNLVSVLVVSIITMITGLAVMVWGNLCKNKDT